MSSLIGGTLAGLGFVSDEDLELAGSFAAFVAFVGTWRRRFDTDGGSLFLYRRCY